MESNEVGFLSFRSWHTEQILYMLTMCIITLRWQNRIELWREEERNQPKNRENSDGMEREKNDYMKSWVDAVKRSPQTDAQQPRHRQHHHHQRQQQQHFDHRRTVIKACNASCVSETNKNNTPE